MTAVNLEAELAELRAYRRAMVRVLGTAQANIPMSVSAWIIERILAEELAQKGTS